jgi:hypothetical protein
MSDPGPDLTLLVSLMEPVLNEGVYVYSSVPPGTDLSSIPLVALFREREGLTLIAPEAEALKAGLPILFRAAWITLMVNSDLQSVGLTAVFASALGNARISCNVMAGAYHDHIFVPAERAEEAMSVLRSLQLDAAHKARGQRK